MLCTVHSIERTSMLRSCNCIRSCKHLDLATQFSAKQEQGPVAGLLSNPPPTLPTSLSSNHRSFRITIPRTGLATGWCETSSKRPMSPPSAWATSYWSSCEKITAARGEEQPVRHHLQRAVTETPTPWRSRAYGCEFGSHHNRRQQRPISTFVPYHPSFDQTSQPGWGWRRNSTKFDPTQTPLPPTTNTPP